MLNLPRMLCIGYMGLLVWSEYMYEFKGFALSSVTFISVNSKVF